jgi:hypothetical protein
MVEGESIGNFPSDLSFKAKSMEKENKVKSMERENEHKLHSLVPVHKERGKSNTRHPFLFLYFSYSFSFSYPLNQRGSKLS